MFKTVILVYFLSNLHIKLLKHTTVEFTQIDSLVSSLNIIDCTNLEFLLPGDGISIYDIEIINSSNCKLS